MLTTFATIAKKSLLLTATALILTVGMLTIPSSCLAQSRNYRACYRRPAARITWYRHASTVREGHLRGLADLQRAIGERRRNEALARLYLANAKRQQIQNRRTYVANYFAVKRINREARYGVRDRSASRAARKAKAQARARQVAERRKANPVQVFNSATGKIHWPSALQGRVFAAERQQLESLLAQQRKPTVYRRSVSIEVKHLANDVLQKLRDQIRELPTKDYLAAKRFVVALKAAASETNA